MIYEQAADTGFPLATPAFLDAGGDRREPPSAGASRDVLLLEQATVRWQLTRRQAEVLALVAQGDANKEIATKLDAGLRTVEVHIGCILRKARVESRARLIARFWAGDR